MNLIQTVRSALRRTFKTPVINLNRSDRRALERGRTLLRRCEAGDQYKVSLPQGLEFDKKSLVLEYVGR